MHLNTSQKKSFNNLHAISIKLNLFTILSFCILLNTCSQNERESNQSSFLTEITNEVNLNFIHDPAVDGSYYMPESIGSGGAFLDYDNDGDLDIYLVNCAEHGKNKKSNKNLRNQLFRQEIDGKFTNVTDISGLGDTGYGMGVAVGDYDNDGFVDVYISNAGPDVLYHNNGNGTFTNVTNESGIDNPDWGISTIFLDYNLDGYLDIFVANYVNYDTSSVCTDRVGIRDYCGPQSFPNYADRLFKNNGNGSFTDVSYSSGIATKKGAGLGVISTDLNNDTYPDIYVGNDREQNYLWINQKDGTFKEEAMMLGVGYNSAGKAEASMGIAIGDVENDGDLDLYMGHFRGESNTLYRNMGDIGFNDDTTPAALSGSSIQHTGFGTGFFDFDNDGDLDIAVVNGAVIRGHLYDKNKPIEYWDHYAEPNLVYENYGNGNFKNISNQVALFSEKIENSRGLIFGDINNDGDIDLLVCNEGGKARLYQNDFKNSGNWLNIRAIDPELNRDAYGAKIKIKTNNKTLLRIINPGYSFCSSNDPRAHFGFGSISDKVNIEIVWPDGLIENISGIDINQFITINKGKGVIESKR